MTPAIEMIAILCLGVIVFAVSSHYDVLENFVEFSKRHEGWELDELLVAIGFLFLATGFFSLRRWRDVAISEKNLRDRNQELEKAMTEIRRLRGILPICASCKKIRDDKGYWHQVESYIRDHTEAEFSHGICPDCVRVLYPNLVLVEEDERQNPAKAKNAAHGFQSPQTSAPR